MDGHDFGSSSHMDFGHDFSNDLNNTSDTNMYDTDDGFDAYRNNAYTDYRHNGYEEQTEVVNYNYNNSERQAISDLPFFQVEEKGGFWHNLFKGWW